MNRRQAKKFVNLLEDARYEAYMASTSYSDIILKYPSGKTIPFARVFRAYQKHFHREQASRSSAAHVSIPPVTQDQPRWQ